MQESYDIYLGILQTLEANRVYRTTVPCEPQLGPRGLYPSLGDRTHREAALYDRMALLAYADGKTDLIEIAEKNYTTVRRLELHVPALLESGLLEEVSHSEAAQ